MWAQLVSQSNSCREWRKALKLRKYSFCHLHLTPTKCGIPNDRPRYYSIAVLLEDSTALSLNKEFRKNIDESIHEWFVNVIEMEDKLDESPPIHTSIKPLGVEDQDNNNGLLPISQFLDSGDVTSELHVSEKVLNSNSSWCFDMVTPTDRSSACFTSSYGKFVRGTGSVLYTGTEDGDQDKAADKIRRIPPEQRQFDSNWKDGLDLNGNLRYFSGTEIARLFGFPVTPIGMKDGSQWSFRFPPDCTLKQQWKLMGNSLNVRVASKICEVALRLVLLRSK